MGCSSQSLGVRMNEPDSETDIAMRQLEQLAGEIDKAQALPATPEEQAEQEEHERQQDINRAALGVADDEYTKAVGLGVNAAWSMAFPNWELEEAELNPMAHLTRMVIDKHFPDAMEKAGPEVMLFGVVAMAITARVRAGIPARVKINAGDELNEQG
jgi:hypothetical protein